MNFWERVQEIIVAKKIERKTLGFSAGFDPSCIGKGIRSGSFPYADTALKIAKELGVSVEYLVYGESDGVSSECNAGCGFNAVFNTGGISERVKNVGDHACIGGRAGEMLAERRTHGKKSFTEGKCVMGAESAPYTKGAETERRTTGFSDAINISDSKRTGSFSETESSLIEKLSMYREFVLALDALPRETQKSILTFMKSLAKNG